MKNDELKEVVKEKYSKIALRQVVEETACCSCSSTTGTYTSFSEDYSKLSGYSPDADLKLGCGVPTEAARIKPGDTVLDLGSGAGNDAFVARSLVGEEGRVIGLDMTEAMIEKARRNTQTLGYSNVEFHLGEIEQMPLPDETADVIISNCVLNLVPDKRKAFSEMMRVLKKGGHFTVSDMVLHRPLPEELKEAAELYAGCVAGALLKHDYLAIINAAGFENVEIVIEKPRPLSEDVLRQYLSPAQIEDAKKQPDFLLSVTVYGERTA